MSKAPMARMVGGRMAKSEKSQAVAAENVVVAFPTAMGWIALAGDGETLQQLAFGHKSARAAIESLAPIYRDAARRETWSCDLVARLKAYAAGEPTDFPDVPVDLGPLTEFRRRVILACRRIPLGQTRTYGQLAAMAGAPKAARAVGNCMASNRIPLVVPCHRVVPSTGRLGGYSGGCGVETKRRLLELESRGV
jgi:methylated-DNA-[protein]-cysteine S-methyltransferase